MTTLAEPTVTPSEQPSLPPGWAWTTLGEVAEYINGRGFKSSEWGTEGRPILRIQNLTGSGSTLNRFDGFVEERHIVRDGELLISWAATLGAYIYKGEEAALNQHIFKVHPFIDTTFLYFGVLHYIRHLKAQSRGSGMQHITKGDFEGSAFPLPPLAEQGRIVAKIEELFSKLDAGVVELKRTQALLKRYRQSLLHAAVTGELTREWREEHGTKHPDGEPAQRLLQRILEERRAKWTASGKRGKYVEPQGPDVAGLPELPTGWVWAGVGQAFEVAVGATPSRVRPDFWGGDIPWVSSGEVAFCRIRKTRESITAAGYKATSTNIHPPGTVLIGMIGEGRTRGQVAILDIAACNNQNSAAIRVSETPVLPEYLYHYLASRYDESRRAASGNNQPALSKSRVEAMTFPLSPLAEQAQIVTEVERRLSILDNMEATVVAELKRAEATRQSILHRAFSGRLVPQDPADEPASALLERIQEEKIKAGAAAIRGRVGRGKRALIE